jgi:hypothetical protein
MKDKIYIDQFIYDIITVQPISWDLEEEKLVKEQIPDYDDCTASGATIIRAQKIVADYRKTIYEVRKHNV